MEEKPRGFGDWRSRAGQVQTRVTIENRATGLEVAMKEKQNLVGRQRVIEIKQNRLMRCELTLL